MIKLNQNLLARYYDGELSPRKARKIEQLLRESPEHQESLKKMTQLGELLRLANEEKMESVSFERFEQQVTAGISKGEDSTLLEQLKVWVSEFFSYRKAVWVPTAVVAGAALAALLVLPLSTPTQVEDKAPTGNRNDTWIAADDTSKGGSKIESVTFDDTGDSSDSKFEVSKIDGQNGSVGVVWIVDTP
jgi:anti-sigma factor RsiW